MTFSPSQFALFFSVPLDEHDWENLKKSKVKRVQVVGDMYNHNLLTRLEDYGVQGVAVRLDNSVLSNGAMRLKWRDILAQSSSMVDTVILGTEFDAPFNLRYGAAWGNEEAWKVAADVQRMVSLIPGKMTVSPAFTRWFHYRDWKEGAQPGRWTWAEETRNSFNSCTYNGFHWYGGDTSEFDTTERMRVDLWLGQSQHHKPLWIDEFGIDPEKYTNVQLMQTYLVLASSLVEGARGYEGAGERVVSLTPFVSNGISDGSWNPRYVLRDPAAYEMVGEFMDGRRW